MTQQVFADFLQQSPATLSSIFNGRTRPTLQVIDAIKSKIPDISIEWLLYGTGEMYISHPQDTEEPVLGGQMKGQEQTLNFDSPFLFDNNVPQKSGSMSGLQHSVINTRPEIVREEVKTFEKMPRKVTEIRVYYDDQTYETFVPAKK